MSDTSPIRFAGVELYFDDLAKARQFYVEVLGLAVAEDDPEHHVKLSTGSEFVCLERKRAENYPSQDKAVLFFEVADLPSVIQRIGATRFMRVESHWAVLHDPEGHNILLLERG
jgi:catechol-2,3-dioxygenase